MAEIKKFLIIRKLLKTLGISEEAIDDIIQWIEELLSGKGGKKNLNDFPYSLRDDFLSPAEKSFYLVLKNSVSDWAIVCPKVNLGDLFYAKCKNFRERQSYTNRINRKHVDFLLCDIKTAEPILGIELDDKSHNTTKRKERDYFVEGVFEAANFPLERFPVQYTYSPTELNKRLSSKSNIKSEENEKFEDNQQNTSQEVSDPKCPKCGGQMVLRQAKSGKNKGQQFWGCSNFPRCRSILPFTANEN